MYNPMYYLAGNSVGFGSSTVAKHWRIRTGIEQGDTSLTTEVNLALALRQRADVADVDFETVWGKGHTTAERSGDGTENLIAWIAGCV
jgi:poly(3-hydroxybutyrate) depolymerase